MTLRHSRTTQTGLTLVEALTAITISAGVLAVVAQVTLRIQFAYRQMEQANHLARDGWNLEWDLRHDASRQLGQVHLLPDLQSPTGPPAAVEWSSKNRDHIVRYRHDAERHGLVREEEHQGQVTRRDRYRIPERSSVEWSLFPHGSARYLVLRTTVSGDILPKPSAVPVHLIVGLPPPSKEGETKP